MRSGIDKAWFAELLADALDKPRSSAAPIVREPRAPSDPSSGRAAEAPADAPGRTEPRRPTG